jgi:predicted dithiol-disulfide oxidoreductase (DUF899 family)
MVSPPIPFAAAEGDRRPAGKPKCTPGGTGTERRSSCPSQGPRCRSFTAQRDADFGVDEWHGTNAFLRDGDRIFRTYFVNNRGDEAMGSTWSYFDLTALGRQEEWEDSPEGYPQTPPYEWWNLHDEYSAG